MWKCNAPVSIWKRTSSAHVPPRPVPPTAPHRHSPPTPPPPPPLKQLCCFGPALKAVLITGAEHRSEWQAGSILLKPNERNLCRVRGPRGQRSRCLCPLFFCCSPRHSVPHTPPNHTFPPLIPIASCLYLRLCLQIWLRRRHLCQGLVSCHVHLLTNPLLKTKKKFNTILLIKVFFFFCLVRKLKKILVTVPFFLSAPVQLVGMKIVIKQSQWCWTVC